MARRAPGAVDNDFSAFLAQEIKKAQASGQGIPPLEELKQLGPDDKRFYVSEAAAYLHAELPLPPALAKFVAELISDYVESPPIREAGKEIAKGKTPHPERAHWIADWLLNTPRFRGRPRTERPKDLRVAATFYLQRHEGQSSERATLNAVAKLFTCSLDYVRKCRKKYEPMGLYEPDDLIHLLCTPPPKTFATSTRTRQSDAASFLRRILAKGSLSSNEIARRANAGGYSKRTIARAKKALGISAVRTGRHWAWRLPPSVPNQ
jgi:hypothetical protein